MAEMDPFAEMPGGKVFLFVHTILLETADKRKRLLKTSSELSQIPISPTERQEIRALEAAADMIQFAISAGQDAASHKQAAPEWVLRMAAQGRNTMRNFDID
jgi:hypothetical protein